MFLKGLRYKNEEQISDSRDQGGQGRMRGGGGCKGAAAGMLMGMEIAHVFTVATSVS